MASFLIAPGSKGAEEIEAEYNLPGVAEFIRQAVNKYVEDISKNLMLNEVPNCSFNKVDGSEKRTGDSFLHFAEVVQANQKGK